MVPAPPPSARGLAAEAEKPKPKLPESGVHNTPKNAGELRSLIED
jgi:hypothetical protein